MANLVYGGFAAGRLTQDQLDWALDLLPLIEEDGGDIQLNADMKSDTDNARSVGITGSRMKNLLAGTTIGSEL